MLARLLQACVWNIFHCGAQGNAKVYARRISCSLAIWWVLKTQNRWGSTPRRTCQVHLSRVRIPPYAIIAYRQWYGDCRKRHRWRCAKARENVIQQPQSLGREMELSFLSAMRFLPCSEMDTVYQTYEPKDFFPLICATT